MANLLFCLMLGTLIWCSSAAESIPTVDRQTGAWDACIFVPGICINVNTYSCSSSTVRGLCRGASNIRCCPFTAGLQSSACTAKSNGVCTRSENCKNNVIPGKCPGPSRVTCCSSSQKFPTPSPSLARQTGAWSACSSVPGICMDVNAYSCFGSTLRGLCPGASNIRCCPYPAGI